jgi:hypothetical protein
LQNQTRAAHKRDNDIPRFFCNPNTLLKKRDLDLAGYKVKVIDSHTMEISVQKNQGLNDVFAVLTAKAIHVSSMRSKANRLEELFVTLVAGGNA